MVGRVIEIVERGRSLFLEYGNMVIRSGEEVIARVALDDILALVVNPCGAMVSSGLLSALAERNIPFVVSAPNFTPIATLMPLAGNFEVAARIESQVNASAPLRKQAWKQVIQSKVIMQALALEATGVDSSAVRSLISEIRSGDTTNVEAQAARLYWPRMFGGPFRRDPDLQGLNSLLNYGYAVIRAATARAIAASGLHPSIGIHHAHPLDTMRLADDLVEPYRPLVDCRVRFLSDSGILEVKPESKRALVAILTTDIPTPVGTSPVSVAIHRTSQSFVHYLRGEIETLELPGEESIPVLSELASGGP